MPLGAMARLLARMLSSLGISENKEEKHLNETKANPAAACGHNQKPNRQGTNAQRTATEIRALNQSVEIFTSASNFR
jgi:hypothetical protein